MISGAPIAAAPISGARAFAAAAAAPVVDHGGIRRRTIKRQDELRQQTEMDERDIQEIVHVLFAIGIL